MSEHLRRVSNWYICSWVGAKTMQMDENATYDEVCMMSLSYYLLKFSFANVTELNFISKLCIDGTWVLRCS